MKFKAKACRSHFSFWVAVAGLGNVTQYTLLCCHFGRNFESSALSGRAGGRASVLRLSVAMQKRVVWARIEHMVYSQRAAVARITAMFAATNVFVYIF